MCLCMKMRYTNKLTSPSLKCQLQALQLETYSHQIIMTLTLAAETLHCDKSNLSLRNCKGMFTLVACVRFGSSALRFAEVAHSGGYVQGGNMD